MYAVMSSLRRTSYPVTSFFRKTFPVRYHTDEGCAEEAEKGRRVRTSKVWLACARRAFTTLVADGCWLPVVSGGVNRETRIGGGS